MNKGKILLSSIVGVLCLTVMTASTTYAYFTPRISAEGTDIETTLGSSSISISDAEVDVSGISPIYESNALTDSTVPTKTFTITKDSGSVHNNMCISIYLEVDNIGTNLKSEYFKYYISGNSTTATGNFSTSSVTYTSNTASILLLSNQQLSNSVSSISYTMKFWYAYSDSVDQSALMTGTLANRSFTGHIKAVGVTGTCSN